MLDRDLSLLKILPELRDAQDRLRLSDGRSSEGDQLADGERARDHRLHCRKKG